MRLCIFLLASFCLSACSGTRTYDSQLQARRARDLYLEQGRYKEEYLKKVSNGHKQVVSSQYKNWKAKAQNENKEYVEQCKRQVLSFFAVGGLDASIAQSRKWRADAIRQKLMTTKEANSWYSEQVADFRSRRRGGERRKANDLKKCEQNYSRRAQTASHGSTFRGSKYDYIPQYKEVKAFRDANYRYCNLEKKGEYFQQYVCLDERQPGLVKIFRY